MTTKGYNTPRFRCSPRTARVSATRTCTAVRSPLVGDYGPRLPWGRVVAVRGDRVVFDDSAATNVAAGDAFAARVRVMIDDTIRRRGVAASPAELDDDAGPIELDPPRTLDLRADDIGSVIWCIGFTREFSRLYSALTDGVGAPRRVETASTVAGVWYVGLRWLVTRGSELLYGIPRDATTVAHAVRAHLQRA